MTSAESDALVDRYDAALFDLDGVVYLGPEAVPGAAEGIAGLRQRGVRVGFVTNNAARPPAAVAAHLVELGITAEPSDVVTSAQAGARLLAERFGRGARVLAVGGAGVHAALDEVGLIAVSTADDGAVAVIQGYDPTLNWQLLTEAAIAVQRGAHWLATNTDPTRPTDRGLVPGNGAMVDAVRTAVEVEPEIAGKPYPPLITETLRRLGGERLDPSRSVFVGDRLDTDVAGAAAVGLDSLLVLTGAHGPRELLAAVGPERPTHVGADLRALLAPVRTAVPTDGGRRCGASTATVVDGTLVLDRVAPGPAGALDALWAAATAAWDAADAGASCDTGPAVRGPLARLAASSDAPDHDADEVDADEDARPRGA